MVDTVEHFEGCTRIRSIVKEKNQRGKSDRCCIDRGDDLRFWISVDIREDLGRVQNGINLV